MLKANELRALPIEELRERLDTLLKQHYEHRVQATIKELQNTALLRIERRDIARLKMVIAEKLRQAEQQSV
jgi:large subunit ribosomal protein L29